MVGWRSELRRAAAGVVVYAVIFAAGATLDHPRAAWLHHLLAGLIVGVPIEVYELVRRRRSPEQRLLREQELAVAHGVVPLDERGRSSLLAHVVMSRSPSWRHELLLAAVASAAFAWAAVAGGSNRMLAASSVAVVCVLGAAVSRRADRRLARMEQLLIGAGTQPPAPAPGRWLWLSLGAHDADRRAGSSAQPSPVRLKPWVDPPTSRGELLHPHDLR